MNDLAYYRKLRREGVSEADIAMERRYGRGYLESRRRMALHDRLCAINQGGYCGGPCTCGLVDPSVMQPLDA